MAAQNTAGQVLGQLRREVGVLRLQLGDLKFYTEDFRENHLQIAARLMTNVELLNMEAGGIERNRRAIDDVSNRVGALEGMMQRMLVFLGIEEKEVCECGRSSVLVHHTGLGSTSYDSPSVEDNMTQTKQVSIKSKATQIKTDFKNAETETKIVTTSDAETETKNVTTSDAETETKNVTTSDAETETKNVITSDSGVNSDKFILHTWTEDFLPPAPQMVEKAGQPDPKGWGTIAMCTPAGYCPCRIEDDEPVHQRWKDLINGVKDDCAIAPPSFLLPASLGGGMIHAGFKRIKGTDPNLRVYFLFVDNPYNAPIQFPFRARIALRIFNTPNGRLLVSKEEVLQFDKLDWGPFVADVPIADFDINMLPYLDVIISKE